ncbi:MAG: hypothetical protein IPG59_22985 [Candidatus Melainabacteria bacterium]|nr:MAG: hypothetical protein IPG59_22985 [Candidatus Melainabacteria bacterium]
MASKPPTILEFSSDIEQGAAIEFVGLVAQGTVVESKVSSIAATYVFEKQEIVVKNSKQRSATEFKAEVEVVRGALQLLRDTSGDNPIDERGNLTPIDLGEIWQSLAHATQPIDALLCDEAFVALFPFADLVAGTYESLRHKSGCVIDIETRKDGTLLSHRIDAPNPVSTKAPSNCGIFKTDGYLGTDESRWHISKMLGAVPSKHKSKVFAWAHDAINLVDEFHNTHGGVQLPEIFECHYDDVHLTCDRDLRFEKR